MARVGWWYDQEWLGLQGERLVRYNGNPRPCQYFGVIDRHTGHRRECYGAAKKGRRYCNRHQPEEIKYEEAMRLR